MAPKHFWNKLDLRLKLVIGITTALIGVGSILWASGSTIAAVARVGLERTFATKTEVGTCRSEMKTYHDESMKTHMDWSKEHDEVLISKSIERTVERLKKDGYVHR